ncbi:MAG: thiamine-phosphate pyrophosphorylase [Candidatus Margulisiibacteriota bacterium]
MTNDKLFRILDANINRAMEGLRVVEEIVRFILDDKKLTLKIKNLRAELKKIVSKLPKKELLSARASLSDVGGKLYTKSESKRSKTEELFYSNIKRCEEAVRVLEEFSKYVNPKLGKNFKAIRFKLYDLEKQIARQLTASEGDGV